MFISPKNGHQLLITTTNNIVVIHSTFHFKTRILIMQVQSPVRHTSNNNK